MAGHVRFGAKTGGALIILGTILVFLAVFMSSSVEAILQMFPAPVLGVILFITGGQLALGGTCDPNKSKSDRFVWISTAAFAVWNMGVALLFGIALHHLLKRGLMKL